ncbi:hypothetical protein FOCC_FOCC006207 [Frankliniella occidentalis]|uniref:Uncharacterized protein LOC127749381 n=1 Tax=Frankliniella occidentalis TaxID=133901 RepID=A0A9C6TZQ1_FRAOC|nr:uncharacterized protein LOC127749381 [Frankliniella occidentalis]KAE8747069.1 hypothetical protein FOCC_FOCC006207 [Frankliniella occidentalis]
MQRDDESRRGPKRPAPSTESPPRDDDEHRPGVQPEVMDPLARAQLRNFPSTGFQGAKGFTSQPTDFSPKTFISGEFQGLNFERVEAKFTAGSEFASQSTGQFASTPATFDATSHPSTSHEHEELIFSDTLQHTDKTRTVGLEQSIFRITSTPYESINVSHSEEFHHAMAQEVPALGQESTIPLQDTHDLFSALFPSYSRYLHGGFGGIGSEDSQYVQTNADMFGPTPDFTFKPACFYQPEEDLNDEPSKPTDIEMTESDRIYPGSRISIHESVMSILTFAQTEKLTGAALGRLLSLIDIHCPAKNNLVKNTAKLYDHLKYLNSDFELSYYCNLCWRAKESAHDLCDKCKDPKRKVHFFVHFSLAEQLKALYKRPAFLEALKYRQTRSKINENAIEDIIDGELYQEVLKGFLSDVNNLSLMWYTDGIQLFESTSFSIWPQFFVLLELPPEQRFKPENMLLAGLWGSQDHPHPNVVLRHIVNDLITLREKVVEVQPANSNELKVVKVCCLCGTCDSPAKSAFANLKGHAGYYSCPVCFSKGEKSEATENVMVFPFENEVFLRSLEGYSELVSNSVKEYKKSKDKDESCKGVQGPTLLSLMFYLSMFKSLGIDSMHCIFMGVVKQILHLSFDSKFNQEPFSLRDKLEEVDSLLSNIQLPKFVQRLPVSVDKLSFWKASLCLNYFFHMMLPVMKTVMKPEYFEHLLLLVDSVAILNSSSISLDDIEKADVMLGKFVEDFSKLYKLRNMSLNVHLCRHLATSVRNLGPLWATSCFPFEDFNGKLINLAHGTSDSLIQISRRFPILTGLSTEIDKMSVGPARDFCEQLLFKWKRYHIKERISDQSFVVGFFDQSLIYSTEISELLLSLLKYEPKFHTFPKLYHNKQLFVASSYTRSVRKSSAVKYVTSEGVNYGDILTFVKVVGVNYFALIKKFCVAPFSCTSPTQLSYICKVVDVAGHDFVNIKDLQSVCFYISVGDTCYISNTLNQFERF